MQGVRCVTFFFMAVRLWLKRPRESPEPRPQGRWARATLLSFVAVFLPEWGDPGQLAAALLVAQHVPPLVVWFAATLAMVTKATLAATVGIGLRKWVPYRVARPISVAVCLCMGVLAAAGVD